MARWRDRPDLFPAPLREFREEDWPRVEGECLGHYACRGLGYSAECVPRPGEFCGQLCYERTAELHPDRPEILAAALAADAFTRFHEARLSWLEEDSEEWAVEFFERNRHWEIREAPFRDTTGRA